MNFVQALKQIVAANLIALKFQFFLHIPTAQLWKTNAPVYQAKVNETFGNSSNRRKFIDWIGSTMWQSSSNFVDYM